MVGCVTAASADTPQLEVTGGERALRDNVSAFVAIDRYDCDAPDWQLERFRQRIITAAEEALKPFGYYAPSVSVVIAPSDTCWRAAIELSPGEPTLIRRATVAIDPVVAALPEITRVLATVPTTGDVLIHSRYEQLKLDLQAALNRLGYFDHAFVRQRLDVFPSERYALIDLEIDSGVRYRLGDIALTEDILDASFLQRFVKIKPGEPFSRGALDRLQADLSTTTYFDRVLVTPDYDAASDGVVPINVELTAAEKLGYFLGVGASTDQGPRFRGGYRNRRVNGRGHQFDAGILYSPVLSQLTTAYRQPLADPTREWQTIALQFESEETDTSSDRRWQAGIERTLALQRDWLFSYGASVINSRFTVADVTDTSTLVMPVVGFSRRIADDPANPRRGSALEIQLRAGSKAVLSSTDVAQLYVRYRRLWPIGSRGRLALRGEFGVTAQDDFDALPPSIRFFAGGDNSVRGYGYQTIGPEDDNGDVIGGSQLATASVEYEHLLSASWGVAAFVDAGNAFDDANIDARIGTGLGVVWRSPVGPLRAYLATPVNEDGGLRVHISFGADL
ncbi:MAG: autotransporter assembly complex family protein [Pseudomonadota bacterium]